MFSLEKNQSENVSLNPTVLHITHHKAGSQWIKSILTDCFPEKIVEPKLYEAQFLKEPIYQGKIYPTIYISKQQFDTVELPKLCKKFIVIRDLRDTLISMYFSYKISHVFTSDTPLMIKTREILNSVSLDDGLIYLMEHQLPWERLIQLSWIQSGEPVIRYEELLKNDINILSKLLIDDFHLQIDHERLHQIIIANRFVNITGRAAGMEKIDSHNRKGVSGDWKNYFSKKVKGVFKEQYGNSLIQAGYEKDTNW